MDPSKLPPLNLSITPSSSAATGSDMVGQDQQFSFGPIYSGGRKGPLENIVRDVAVGLAVALVLKQIGGKFLK